MSEATTGMYKNIVFCLRFSPKVLLWISRCLLACLAVQSHEDLSGSVLSDLLTAASPSLLF